MWIGGCPPSIAIGELTLGVLAAGVATLVAGHLLRCPSCAAEWDGFCAYMAEEEVPQSAARTRSSFSNGKEDRNDRGRIHRRVPDEFPQRG